MSGIAQALDDRLRELDPVAAAVVESRVREVLAEVVAPARPEGNWSAEFWQRLRAGWGDEPFERPPQGEFEIREEW